MINNEYIENYFRIGIFFIVVIFAIVAIASLYLSIETLFGIWLDYRFKPIFDITFNLSVLIICIYIIKERLIKK
jgi:hypothetical protein